jgi:hypothetical protein
VPCRLAGFFIDTTPCQLTSQELTCQNIPTIVPTVRCQNIPTIVPTVRSPSSKPSVNMVRLFQTSLNMGRLWLQRCKYCSSSKVLSAGKFQGLTGPKTAKQAEAIFGSAFLPHSYSMAALAASEMKPHSSHLNQPPLLPPPPPPLFPPCLPQICPLATKSHRVLLACIRAMSFTLGGVEAGRRSCHRFQGRRKHARIH